ncbi:unnamed protein product [Caenorhabditis brenneri]
MSEEIHPVVTNFDEGDFEILRKNKKVFKENLTMEDLIKLKKIFQKHNPNLSSYSTSFTIYYQNYSNPENIQDPNFPEPIFYEFLTQVEWYFKVSDDSNSEKVLAIFMKPLEKMIEVKYTDVPEKTTIYD